MLNPFDWIRSRVAQAFVDGCADGLDALDAAGTVPPAALERLHQRLALPVPAPPAAAPPAEANGAEAGAVRSGKRGGK
jgi:hypothetical protein